MFLLEESRVTKLYVLQPLLENSPVRGATSHGTTKYSKLENEIDSPNRHFLDSTLSQQSQLLQAQDAQLDMISHSLSSLKTVSRQIGSELDEQAVSVQLYIIVTLVLTTVCIEFSCLVFKETLVLNT